MFKRIKILLRYYKTVMDDTYKTIIEMDKFCKYIDKQRAKDVGSILSRLDHIDRNIGAINKRISFIEMEYVHGNVQHPVFEMVKIDE